MRQLTGAKKRTILAASRYWQEVRKKGRLLFSHFIDVDPLDNNQIEELCSVFNGEQSNEFDGSECPECGFEGSFRENEPCPECGKTELASN